MNRPCEARSLVIFGTTELNTNARRRSCDRTNSLVRSSIDMTAARRESSACLRQRCDGVLRVPDGKDDTEKSSKIVNGSLPNSVVMLGSICA